MKHLLGKKIIKLLNWSHVQFLVPLTQYDLTMSISSRVSYFLEYFKLHFLDITGIIGRCLQKFENQQKQFIFSSSLYLHNRNGRFSPHHY